MAANVLHRCQDRLLDGARIWGAVEIRPARFGVIHYRLVVYPPGLSRSERRWVRVARGWPMWGLLVWLMCEITLSGSMAELPAFCVAGAAAAGSGLAAAILAGEARTRVRVLVATTMAGFPDPDACADRDRVKSLGNILTTADERLARGDISIVEHEFIWWRVYDRLERPARSRPRAV